MDHRLAAGIEYLAAQMQSVQTCHGLITITVRVDYTGAMVGHGYKPPPALGEQIRPYWGTVIGHYEGIKGVEMPFSKAVYEKWASTAADRVTPAEATTTWAIPY